MNFRRTPAGMSGGNRLKVPSCTARTEAAGEGDRARRIRRRPGGLGAEEASEAGVGTAYPVRMAEHSPRRSPHPRLGAVDDLGLDLRWQYCFVAPATAARSHRDTVYLDVGGRIESGVLDHHQEDDEGRTRSTTRLIVERPELVYEHLMSRWLDRDDPRSCRGREWNPLVVVHSRPDVDAMVSTWMVHRLVEDGGFPVSASVVADFTDEIDQGEFELKVESGSCLLGLLAVVCDLGEAELASVVRGRLEGSEDESRLLIGVSILAHWNERFVAMTNDERRADPRGREIDLSQGVVPLVGSQGCSVLLPELVKEYGNHINRFIETMEAAAGKCRRFKARVPYSAPPTSRETVEVTGIVLPKEVVDSTRLALYFARNGIGQDSGEMPPDLVIEDRGELDGVQDKFKARALAVSVRRGIRVPASSDSDADIWRRPNLRGLGFKLETAEQEARRRNGAEAARERVGPTRFAEFPQIKDPWYDGRGHGHAIVETPWVGSLLSTREVEALVSRPFWEPEIATMSVAVFRGDSDQPNPDTGLEVGGRSLAEVLEGAGVDLGSAREPESFRLLQLEVHPAWDIRSIRELLNRFIGGQRHDSEIEGSRFLFGPRGVVCLTPRDRESPDWRSLVDQVAPVWAMNRAILETTRSVGGDRVNHDIERFVSTFVSAVSKYRTEPRVALGSDTSRPRLSIRSHVADVLKIESMIEATDRLLEHLDDQSERKQNRRMNVILLLVSFLAVFEVGAALVQHFQESVEVSSPPDALWFDYVWWFMTWCTGLILFVALGMLLVPRGRELLGWWRHRSGH